MTDGISITASHAAVATIFGFLGTLIGSLLTKRKRDDTIDAKNVYERLRLLESSVSGIQTDIEWIRKSLDKIEKRN